MTSVDRVSELERLYMSDCAISKIEAGAFVDLVRLRWLDLSDNRLASLSDGTFAGLHLHQLFLNGNHRLALDSGRPFANVTVYGLYLHDCRLSRIKVSTLAPLDGSLRVLWLSENRLTRLEPALSRLFASLDQFRLADNRLHCNCELSWLWRLHDDQRRRADKDLTSEEAAECVSPTSLRGRLFSELTSDDLRCRAPTLADVEATLIDDDDDDDVGQSSRRRRLVLRCTATGDPTPDIYWHTPPTTARILPPPTSITPKDAVDDAREAVLVLNDDEVQSTSPETRAFTCVASNIVGNVTLTVRHALRTWKVAADNENDEVAPKYTYVNSGLAEMTDVDERPRLIERNGFPAELTARSTCSDLPTNGTDSSRFSADDLCGGRDRRLRASSSLDRRGAQSAAGTDDARQYGVEYLVAAVVVTVLLTAASVVTVVAVCLRHHGRSTRAAMPPQQQPVTDNAAERTASATTAVYDTVVHLTRKSLL